MKRIFSMFSLLVLSSCASYRINVVSSEPSCEEVHPSLGVYHSKEDCYKSDEYQKKLTDYQNRHRYQVYRRDSVVDGNKIVCSSQIYSKAFDDFILGTNFYETEVECKDSSEFKKINSEHLANLRTTRAKALNNWTTRVDSFLKGKPQYSKYRRLLIEKKINIGMPEECVYMSWGQPERINETVTSGLVHKQLVYESDYVYIRNGVITSWQSSR